MKPDFVVTLGEFAFERFEVPAEMPFGGNQMLNTHLLPGGGKVIDVMGAVERDKSWSGLFQGANAYARALQLDTMRVAGLPLKLKWHEQSYTVVIETLELDFQRFYMIPYRITCLVVQNNGRPKSAEPVDADRAIKGDVADASDRAGRINLDSVTGAIRSIADTVRDVQNFVTSTTEEIQRVIAPVLEARDTVQSIIRNIENIGEDPVGAIMSGALGRIADTADGFANQLTSMGQLGELYALDSTLSRITTNLRSIGASGEVIVQAGGDLYQLAADRYGDAAAWVDIARANGETDPMISGVKELILPPAASGADGVLTAAPGPGG